MRRLIVLAVVTVLGWAAYANYATLRPLVAPYADPWLGQAQAALGISAPGEAKSKSAAAPAQKKQLPPAPVVVEPASRRTIPITLDGVGASQARSTVAVKTRVDGQLFEARVTEGQAVKKGDLLFRLDPRPFEAAVAQAEANVARDRANLEKAIADAGRFGELSRKGVSPRTKQDDADAQVAALSAGIRASEAQLAIARLNLEYTVVRAPIDGRVGNILVTPGNMVKANDTQALIVITELKPIHVAFALPEQHLAEIKRRMAEGPLSVSVMPQGDDGPPMVGELFFINTQVDTQTGTIQVMARLANEDQRLIPGQFVRARVTLSSLENVVTVPSRAIQINQQGTYVYVATAERTAELRRVKVGPEVGGFAVVENGLAAGENVVIEGQLRLFPGARLVPRGPGGGEGKGPAGAKGGKGPPQASANGGAAGPDKGVGPGAAPSGGAGTAAPTPATGTGAAPAAPGKQGSPS